MMMQVEAQVRAQAWDGMRVSPKDGCCGWHTGGEDGHSWRGQLGQISWGRRADGSCWQLKSRDSLFGKMALGRNVWRRPEIWETAFLARDGGGSVMERGVYCKEVQELGSAGSLGVRIRFPTSG